MITFAHGIKSLFPLPISPIRNPQYYYKTGMKYPSLYRNLNMLLCMEELDFLTKDGERPFDDQKRLYELAAKGITEVDMDSKPIELRDYLYFTTPIGRQYIEAFDKFKQIQKPIMAININLVKRMASRTKDEKLKKALESAIAYTREFFGLDHQP